MPKIKLSAIQPSISTQARVSIDEPTIQRYTAHLEAGGDFPPSDVFFDGVSHWLADGWHRLIAHQRAGKTEIEALIHTGTERDAMIYALGANAAHGLPRTNADKRKAVEMALADGEIGKLSAREISEICKVSHNMVAEMRKGLSSDDRQTAKTPKNEAGGNVSTKVVLSSDDSSGGNFSTQPEPPPEQNDELAELRSAIGDLDEENKRLKDAIAVGRLSTENQQTAADIIRSLRDKVKTLEATLASVTLSRDEAMREVAQLKQQCQMQQREIKKLKA